MRTLVDRYIPVIFLLYSWGSLSGVPSKVSFFQLLLKMLLSSDYSRVQYALLKLFSFGIWVLAQQQRTQMCCQRRQTLRYNPGSRLITRFPLIGIIVGILTLRPLKGGGL